MLRTLERLFTVAAVAGRDVHDAPVGISRTRGRVENQIGHRVNAAAVLETHQLAGGAFECRIRHVGVGPFDEDRLALGGSECADREA